MPAFWVEEESQINEFMIGEKFVRCVAMSAWDPVRILYIVKHGVFSNIIN